MKFRAENRSRIPSFFRGSSNYLQRLSSSDAAMVAPLRHQLRYRREEALNLVTASGRADLALYLYPLLSDRLWLLRSSAAIAVGDLLAGTNKVPKPLKRLLRDPEWVTRIDALEAVDAIGDWRVLPLLTPALHDSHPIVRSYAGGILGETGWKHYNPLLRKALLRERSERAKVGLLRGLVLLGETRWLDPLLELLKSPDYTMRCAIVHGLEDLKLNPEEYARTIAALEQLEASEPTRAVRTTVAPVLERLRSALASVKGNTEILNKVQNDGRAEI